MRVLHWYIKYARVVQEHRWDTVVHTVAIHNELIMEIEISGIARETWMKNKMKREKYRRVLCRAVRKKISAVQSRDKARAVKQIRDDAIVTNIISRYLASPKSRRFSRKHEIRWGAYLPKHVPHKPSYEAAKKVQRLAHWKLKSQSSIATSF